MQCTGRHRVRGVKAHIAAWVPPRLSSPSGAAASFRTQVAVARCHVVWLCAQTSLIDFIARCSSMPVCTDRASLRLRFLHHRTQRVHTGQTGWPCKDGDISPSACKRVPLRRSPGQAPGRRRERFRLLQAPYAHNSPEILASPLPRRPASLVQRRCKHECEYKESTAARRAPVRAVRRTSSETRVKKAVHDDQSLVR